MFRLRIVLLGLAFGCATPGVQVANPVHPEMAAAPAGPRELLPDEQVQQVLNRLAFGPRPGDADAVRTMGVDRWIDQQLHPERIDDARADAMLHSYPIYAQSDNDRLRDFQVVQDFQRRVQQNAGGDTMKAVATRQQLLASDPALAAAVRASQGMVPEIQSATLARAVVSNRQLDEVMVSFWENHFSVFAGKGQTRLFLARYDRDVIRPHALGKFRDLLEADAKSPAMLFYLDNWQSAADSLHPTLVPRRQPGPLARRLMPQIANRLRPGLNENYARELMELHTLGVDGGYTQQDVINVARALTGWSFNRQSGEFQFNPVAHDAGEKVVLGHKLPAGRGIQDGEDVLDILARAPATAHFISLKLARHFVQDDPPSALVDRCASVFQRTDGDIRETVRCIATSPEFFSRAAFRAKVKTPFEVVASALRAMGASADTTPRSAQMVARLGQPLFGRLTPDGWPDRSDAWMNTGAILNRINFGLAVAGGQMPGARFADWPSSATLRSLARDQQVDGVIKAVLGGEASPETRAVLMSGDNPMMTKGSVADTSMAAPPPPTFGRIGAGGPGRGAGPGRPMPAVNLQGLPQIVGLALGAPEFQRR